MRNPPNELRSGARRASVLEHRGHLGPPDEFVDCEAVDYPGPSDALHLTTDEMAIALAPPPCFVAFRAAVSFRFRFAMNRCAPRARDPALVACRS